MCPFRSVNPVCRPGQGAWWWLLAGVAVCVVPPARGADRLEMVGGPVYEGKILKRTDRAVTIRMDVLDEPKTAVPLERIAAIVRDGKREVLVADVPETPAPKPPRRGPSRLWKDLQAGKTRKLIVYGTSLSTDQHGRWAPALARAINDRLDGGKLVIDNRSDAGANCRWGAQHLAREVIARKPDAVILEFASNDAVVRFGISVAEAHRHWDAMIRALRKQLPDCEIFCYVTAPPWNHRSKGRYAQAARRPGVEHYFAMVRRLAGEHKTYLVDAYDAFAAKMDPPKFQQYRHYIHDGHHPGSRGVREIIVPAMVAAISGQGGPNSPVRRDPWPGPDEQLVFAWQGGQADNTLVGADGQVVRDCRLLRSRFARPMWFGGVDVTAGWAVPDEAGELAKAFVGACRDGGQFGVEIVARPGRQVGAKPASLLSLTHKSKPLLELYQTGRVLWVALHAANTPSPRRDKLTVLAEDEPSHIVVNFSAKTGLAAFVNGKPVRTLDWDGELTNWTGGTLAIGARPDGSANWAGSVEFVAFSAGPRDAPAMHAVYRKLTADRDRPGASIVQATLIEGPAAPKPGQAYDYADGLGMYLYRVDKVHSGPFEGKRLLAVQWVRLNDHTVPGVAKLKPGQSVRLRVSPAASHPELKGVQTDSSGVEDLDALADLPPHFAQPQ